MATLSLAIFIFGMSLCSADTSDRRLPRYLTGDRLGPNTDTLNRHDTNALNGNAPVQSIASNIAPEPIVVDQSPINNQGEQVQQSDAHSEASYNKLEDEIRNADEAIEELKEELVEHEREEELEEEIIEEEMAYYAYDNFERE